jgi:hypothetical protein
MQVMESYGLKELYLVASVSVDLGDHMNSDEFGGRLDFEITQLYLLPSLALFILLSRRSGFSQN